MSVVLPPWSECDGDLSSYPESVSSTSIRGSTFEISKRDNSTATERDDVTLKNKTSYNRIVNNHGTVNITNNVNSTKQIDKKDTRSFQVVSKVTLENKKKAQQRRSVGVRKVTAKSTSTVAGLPQRRLTLKKTTPLVQQRGCERSCCK